MSFLVSLLAGLTRRGESCAVVDGRDAFDPCGAEAAGVALGRLLLVRCSNIEQALRGADLLLHGGGFGLVALDLSDLPGATVRRVPLNAWFRFRRMVENTATILLLLEQESCAKSCASLVLRLEMEAARWNSAAAATAAREKRRDEKSAAVSSGRLANSRGSVAQPLRGGRIRGNEFIFECIGSAPGAGCLYETEAAWTDLTGKRRRGKNFNSGRASQSAKP